MTDSRLKILSGNSNRVLAEEICRAIGEPLFRLENKLAIKTRDHARPRPAESRIVRNRSISPATPDGSPSGPEVS